MCNFSTDFDKGNGTVEAGSYKRSWPKQYISCFTNSGDSINIVWKVDHSALGDVVISHSFQT